MNSTRGGGSDEASPCSAFYTTFCYVLVHNCLVVTTRHTDDRLDLDNRLPTLVRIAFVAVNQWLYALVGACPASLMLKPCVGLRSSMPEANR